MEKLDIYAVVLAAGSSPRLGFPAALAAFGGRRAIEIAVENCAGLSPPIVVLGCQAARVRRYVRRDCRTIIHRKWRLGQLSSFLAGVRAVPARAAVLLYPVDLVLLKPSLVERLVRAFRRRRAGQEILMPCFAGKPGHPVILSRAVLGEMAGARTAREVIYRDQRRVFYLPVNTAAIWRDVNTQAQYSRLRLEVEGEARKADRRGSVETFRRSLQRKREAT